MESLPDLVLFFIAANLSGFDLASWCAASRGWRERLNQDDFWRHRCDSQTAQYLRQTECQVQPFFINPEEEEDTGLSPICEWRLAYMRQIHLWNNWRNNRYSSVFVPDYTNFFTHNRESSPLLMYKRDFLIVCDQYEMQLWNVEESAVKTCVKTLPSKDPIRMLSLSGDSVVVKQSNLLLVFQISIANSEFVLTSSIVTSEASFHLVLLFGSILIEVQENTFTMQVWNIETGEKLKEERKENTVVVRGCNQRLSETYFALTAIRSHEGNDQYFILVYRLPDVVLVFTSKMYDEFIRGIVMVKTHLFIKIFHFIDSYCMETGQYMTPINYRSKTRLEKFDDNVCFIDSRGFFVKLTPGSEEEEIVLANLGYEIVGLNRLNSEYFLATVSVDHGSSHRIWLGRIGSNQPGQVVVLGRFAKIRDIKVNESRSKLFVSSYSETNSITLFYTDDFKESIEVVSYW